MEAETRHQRLNRIHRELEEISESFVLSLLDPNRVDVKTTAYGPFMTVIGLIHGLDVEYRMKYIEMIEHSRRPEDL